MVNATTRWPYIKCTDTVTHLTTNNACVALQLNVNGAKVLTKLFRCVETGLFNSGLKSGMTKRRIRMFNEKYINQCPRAWHRGQMKCSWISSFTLSGDIGSTISMFISFLFSLSFCSLSAPLWISLSFSCFYELSPLFLYAHSIPYPTLDYSFIFILSFTKKISFFSVLSVLFALSPSLVAFYRLQQLITRAWYKPASILYVQLSLIITKRRFLRLMLSLWKPTQTGNPYSLMLSSLLSLTLTHTEVRFD